MIKRIIVLVLVCVWAGAALTSAQEVRPAGSGRSAGPAGADEVGAVLFKNVDPTVVAIQHEEAGGSGFIVDPSGYILTNGHVVSAAMENRGGGNAVEDPTEIAKRITVILSNDEKYQARVIGHSLDPDVALIKIDAPVPLPVVRFGDSDTVKVGQRSYAIGMPLGLKRTLTSGIISNVERTDLGTFTKVIQTDTAINPGNSGGPLFNENGEVLGLNTYGGGGAGLGFTIPINVARVLQDHFMKYGRFMRSDFPFYVPKEIDNDFSRVLGVPGGVLVDYVYADSPAAQAGLANGDVIIAMNGHPVSAPNRAALCDFVWGFTIQPIGSQFDFTVKRKTGREFKELTIHGATVEDEPAIRYRNQVGEVKEIRYDALGLRTEQITYLSRYLYNLPNVGGVRVTTVLRNEPAELGGLTRNDVILELNGQKVGTPEDFQNTLDHILSETPKYIRVLVQRQQETAKAVIKPNYDLKGKKVALILPDKGADNYERIRRYFIMNGAAPIIVGSSKKMTLNGREIIGDTLINDLDVSGLHAIIFLSGDGVDAYWHNDAIHKLVKSANEGEKILGAIGAAAPILIYSDDTLLAKKITSDKDNADLMMNQKANYTGNDIESDGNIFTTTGFNKEVIDGFLAKIKGAIKDFTIKKTEDTKSAKQN